MVKIEITDEKGKVTVLTGDRAFGCVMNREKGRTHCDSYLIGRAWTEASVMGPIMSGVLQIAGEISKENPILYITNLGIIKRELDEATANFISKGGEKDAGN